MKWVSSARDHAVRPQVVKYRREAGWIEGLVLQVGGNFQ